MHDSCEQEWRLHMSPSLLHTPAQITGSVGQRRPDTSLLLWVIGCWRATAGIAAKTGEIFLCCSCSSYLPFTRLMTSLNMQQLNTNQPASFVLCENRENKRLNFTFSGNNANSNTVTCLAPSIISIRAQFSSDGLL